MGIKTEVHIYPSREFSYPVAAKKCHPKKTKNFSPDYKKSTHSKYCDNSTSS